MAQDRWSTRFGPIVGGLALLMFTGTGGQNTDVGAHLLGFVCGFAAGMLLIRDRQTCPKTPPRSSEGRRMASRFGLIAISLVDCAAGLKTRHNHVESRQGDSCRLQQLTMKKILLFPVLHRIDRRRCVLWIRLWRWRSRTRILSNHPCPQLFLAGGSRRLCRAHRQRRRQAAMDESFSPSIRSRDRQATSCSSMCAVQRSPSRQARQQAELFDTAAGARDRSLRPPVGR